VRNLPCQTLGSPCLTPLAQGDGVGPPQGPSPACVPPPRLCSPEPTSAGQFGAVKHSDPLQRDHKSIKPQKPRAFCQQESVQGWERLVASGGAFACCCLLYSREDPSVHPHIGGDKRSCAMQRGSGSSRSSARTRRSGKGDVCASRASYTFISLAI